MSREDRRVLGRLNVVLRAEFSRSNWQRVFGIEGRTWLLFVLGLIASYFGWNLATTKPGYYRTVDAIVWEYSLFASFSLFVVALLYRFGQSLIKVAPRSIALDSVGSIALLASICILGMKQLGGYDHSALIEAGWIQFSSLLPFKDYPCTIPPLLFIGDKFALHLFGLKWSAFVLLMACFAIASFLVLSWQLRLLAFGPLWAAVLAFVAELGTCVICSFWWYNPVTSVICIIVFLSTLICLINPETIRNWILLCISFTLLLVAKPNAWPCGACLLVFLLGRNAGERVRGLAAIVSGVGLAALICWTYGLNPLEVLQTYARIAHSRGNPFSIEVFSDYIGIETRIMLWSVGILTSVFVALLISRRAELRRYWREYLCCIVVAGTSLVMVFTNYELKTSDLMPLVIAVAVVAYRPWSKRSFGSFGHVTTVTIIVVFAVASSYWAGTRLRVRGVGQDLFFQSFPKREIESGFFAGLRTGPRLILVLEQISRVLSHHPSAKVFFGPRLEFSYATFSQAPPAGLPIWWHSGTSFSVDDLPRIISSFEQDKFDLLIFMKNDYTRMPAAILEYKGRFYEEIPGYSELGVYVRKAPLE